MHSCTPEWQQWRGCAGGPECFSPPSGVNAQCWRCGLVTTVKHLIVQPEFSCFLFIRYVLFCERTQNPRMRSWLHCAPSAALLTQSNCAPSKLQVVVLFFFLFFFFFTLSSHLRARCCKATLMEKSKNFRIDALLADKTARELSPGLSGDSPASSPVSCRRAETPSPRTAHLQAGMIPKPGLLNLPHPGLAASLSGMYPSPMYPLSALGAHHPAFAYGGFTQLTQSVYPEHLKAAAIAGSLPLEHWIRAGIMMPRLPDYGCKCCRACELGGRERRWQSYFKSFRGLVYLLRFSVSFCFQFQHIQVAC